MILYIYDLSVLHFSRTFQKVLYLLHGLILNLKLKPQQNLDLFSFLPAQLIIPFLSRDWSVRKQKNSIGRLKNGGFPLVDFWGREGAAALISLNPVKNAPNPSKLASRYNIEVFKKDLTYNFIVISSCHSLWRT